MLSTRRLSAGVAERFSFPGAQVPLKSRTSVTEPRDCGHQQSSQGWQSARKLCPSQQMSPKHWHRLTDCVPRPTPPPPSPVPGCTVGDSSWVTPPHSLVQHAPEGAVQTQRPWLGAPTWGRAAQLSCPGSEGVRRGGQPGGSELARSGSRSSHRRRRKGGEVGRSGAEERGGGASALPRL